jgi:hypothetical protein
VWGDFVQCYYACFKKCKREHPGADQRCHTSCFNSKACKFDCHIDPLIGEFIYAYFMTTLILFAYMF